MKHVTVKCFSLDRLLGALERDQIESMSSFQRYWKIPRQLREGLGLKRQSGMFPDGLESIKMAWKVSRWPRKFLDAWTVSRWRGKFPDDIDNFQMVWTVSRWPGQFPDSLESFQMAWKVFIWPGKFPEGLESFQIFLESLHISQSSFP